MDINAFDTIIEIKLPQISFCAAIKGDYGKIRMHLSISSYDQSAYIQNLLGGCWCVVGSVVSCEQSEKKFRILRT